MSVDLLPALRPSRVRLEQGPHRRPEAPAYAETRLVDQGPARDGGQPARLALFNMAVDSKLRACDLVALRVRDVFSAGRVKERASIVQTKTDRPVRFEITELTRRSLDRWIAEPEMRGVEHLWPSRFRNSPHLSTRQYTRIVQGWVTSIGLEPTAYGTHSMRRTKVAQIYKKTGNLRAVQLCLDTRRWTARSATSASTSTTGWRSLKRSISDYGVTHTGAPPRRTPLGAPRPRAVVRLDAGRCFAASD